MSPEVPQIVSHRIGVTVEQLGGQGQRVKRLIPELALDISEAGAVFRNRP
jgi:hypothetical protein